MSLDKTGFLLLDSPLSEDDFPFFKSKLKHGGSRHNTS
ncbi:hypothetical protein CHCC14559_4168 [Bacillus licheniformis]|nr:hypothetical protein CHCC15292_3442 [Bacillus licheniformis]TWN04196.1 hypothetical protein CHCC14568_2303 [Bacillus licheniformis]TWN30073.1 hypothetical protein CHCC14559_4168 [Bacillus licheniformis]